MAQKNYAFLDGTDNETVKSEIISHIESHGIDNDLDDLIQLLPDRNKEKFATWRTNQELMTRFLCGLNDNMKKNLVRYLEDGKYDMADQLSVCMPDENMTAYQQYVATIKANNTAATTAKNLSDSLGSTAFPFLDGEDDNTKNMLTGLINQGHMEKADQLASVLLSPAKQKAYQQWKQRPRTTNLFFLDGLDQNSKALLTKYIEDGDMSKADQLSTILLSDEKLVLYRQWKSQNAENLPFLKGIDNNLRELMIKAIKENDMKKADGLSSFMLEGEQLQLYQKWRKEKDTLSASNTPGTPMPSPRTNAPTANKKRPAFLNNIEESMAGYCEGLIEKEDFTTLDIIMSEQSPVTQEEYSRWKTEQEKKLPFLKYNNPLNKIIEDLIEKEGASAKVTQLVKSLSPEEQKLYEVWKAKQAPKFIDAVPEAARELVKRNLEKTPGEAMSILRHYPEAARKFEQWTKEGNQLQSSPTPPDTPIRGNTTPSKTRPASYASFQDPDDGPSVTTDIKRRPSQRVPDPRHNLSDVESDDGEHNEDVSSEEENQDVELDPSGFPKNMNICVMGETGVGKSTLINSLINYYSYSTLAEAEEHGVHIMIPSSFNLTTNNYRTTTINCIPTIRVEKQPEKNENFEKGQSSTQEPKTYLFEYGPSKKTVRIIDTPGIGDTRGVEQDAKNFAQILHCLSQYEEIHAILILLKPSINKLTVGFRFCMNELLVHLHRSSTKNIFFCFTNTRGTGYRPESTLTTLKTHFAELRAKHNFTYNLSKDTMFSFDNESFRYLCAKNNNYEFPPDEEKGFEDSWKQSVTETKRLFKTIARKKPHRVGDTLCLNNTRNLINTLSKPLAELTTAIAHNIERIEKYLKEAQRLESEGNDLREKQFIEQEVVEMEKMDAPQTVCTAATCVSTYEVGGRMETLFRTVCHQDCTVENVENGTCPNDELKKCSALKADINKCVKCGHAWHTHMHIRYKMINKMVKIAVAGVQESIKKKESAKQQVQAFSADMQKKLVVLEQQLITIKMYSAEFYAFLKKNSILTHNDAYSNYLDYLLKQTTNNSLRQGAAEQHQRLVKIKQDYEERTKKIQEEVTQGRQVKTVKEINEMINELKKLSVSGDLLKDVQEAEIVQKRKNTQKTKTAMRFDSL